MRNRFIVSILGSTAAFAAASLVEIVLWSRYGSAGEFRDRESHCAENTAGIFASGRDAFLVGNDVLTCGDEKLSGTNYPYDREDTYRHGKISSVVIVIIQIAVHISRDGFGNIMSTTAAATAILGIFKNTDTEDDWLNHLYNGPLIGRLYAIIKSEKFLR